ncbi:MAG: hypothetical protein N2376_08390, partial [Clostridia bacterium]|nr:hypothetical protein [Clostridia bacterium]
HDTRGESDSSFAYKLVDEKLVMDEVDGSDKMYFTFEQDRTAPEGVDRIIGTLTAHMASDYFSADVVVNFKYERADTAPQ